MAESGAPKAPKAEGPQRSEIASFFYVSGQQKLAPEFIHSVSWSDPHGEWYVFLWLFFGHIAFILTDGIEFVLHSSEDQFWIKGLTSSRAGRDQSCPLHVAFPCMAFPTRGHTHSKVSAHRWQPMNTDQSHWTRQKQEMKHLIWVDLWINWKMILILSPINHHTWFKSYHPAHFHLLMSVRFYSGVFP